MTVVVLDAWKFTVDQNSDWTCWYVQVHADVNAAQNVNNTYIPNVGKIFIYLTERWENLF